MIGALTRPERTSRRQQGRDSQIIRKSHSPASQKPQTDSQKLEP